MKYKKSKAIYLLVLLLLSGIALIDKLSEEKQQVEVVVSASKAPAEAPVKYASLNTSINNENQNIYLDEKVYCIDFSVCH